MVMFHTRVHEYAMNLMWYSLWNIDHIFMAKIFNDLLTYVDKPKKDLKLFC